MDFQNIIIPAILLFMCLLFIHAVVTLHSYKFNKERLAHEIYTRLPSDIQLASREEREANLFTHCDLISSCTYYAFTTYDVAHTTLAEKICNEFIKHLNSLQLWDHSLVAIRNINIVINDIKVSKPRKGAFVTTQISYVLRPQQGIIHRNIPGTSFWTSDEIIAELKSIEDQVSAKHVSEEIQEIVEECTVKRMRSIVILKGNK